MNGPNNEEDVSAVQCQIDDRGLATLTLNRPAKSNAFDASMRELFLALLDRLADDASVRVLVLRGAGKHFCAGSDLASMGVTTAPSDERIELLLRLDAFPKPTLALVHGACLGAGLGLACCADIVIADPEAFFSVPEVQLGIPPLGLMPLIVRAIGLGAFRRYGLTGERFGGEEALRLGLVHQLFPVDDFAEAIAGLSDHLLRAAPGAVRGLKQSWQTSFAPDLASLMLGLARQERSFMTGTEGQSGLSSAREKRSPPWYPPKHD
jgi:methylglutaconyl-CoA hydratase